MSRIDDSRREERERRDRRDPSRIIRRIAEQIESGGIGLGEAVEAIRKQINVVDGRMRAEAGLREECGGDGTSSTSQHHDSSVVRERPITNGTDSGETPISSKGEVDGAVNNS